MLSSKEIAKKWEGIAQGKASLSIVKCLLLGILAGMFIAFGALGSTVAQTAIGGGLGKLAGACVFPAGLILVVMAGAELFTGNCLMAGPLTNRKIKGTGLLRNWLFVYLGNFAGSYFMARLVCASGFLWNADLLSAVMTAAVNKCSLPFDAALLRGIGCNILVCGAVWMASGADNAAGKAVCCFFPVMLFVLCGFEHSVANMYYVPLGITIRNTWESSFILYRYNVTALPEGFAENVSWVSFLLNNLLPVTLGNILGGAGLAIVYAKVYKE
ncbi:MAG: formate/nitrite transporter family protein [Clostridia bacterium]|nr:formate/nitrite transporter family protein [Clostridia bacterium]